MMENVNLTDIEGVVACGPRKATDYLDHGYRLLHVADWNKETSMKPMADGTPRTFVQRGIQFALGRPKGVAVYNPAEIPVRTDAAKDT